MNFNAGRAQASRKRGNDLIGMAADDGVAWSDAQIVERGFVAMRAGPQQRGAIANKTGAGGDDPEQDGEGADAGAERDPEAAIGDQFGGFGGIRDVESVA